MKLRDVPLGTAVDPVSSHVPPRPHIVPPLRPKCFCTGTAIKLASLPIDALYQPGEGNEEFFRSTPPV